MTGEQKKARNGEVPGLAELKKRMTSDLRDDGHHDGVAPEHVAEEAAQA